jgi:16S rRNA (cytosine967-C5)-methyltransferase
VVALARQIATRVLERVEKDDAWAAPSLDAELRRTTASSVDAALATQIVYGTLRVALDLEAALAQHAPRPITVDPWTRAALLSATYQLLHLQRVPPHAVVHDAVDLVRTKRGKRLAGFVNAILRRVAEERPESPELPSAVAVPSWLRDSLHRSIGEEHTGALLRIGREAPSFDLRVRADRDRDSVARSILEARPQGNVSSTSLSATGLRVSGAGDPRRLPGYEAGDFAVQEEGAQLIASLLGAGPGDRVLDACAGRGGKTATLLEAVGESGEVVAADLHAHRLDQIVPELERLDLDPRQVQTASVDWTVGRGAVSGDFDRALVDAPCTGLGTLRRRPEILRRSRPDSAAEIASIQAEMLKTVAPLVRPGGTLVYAVCSPLLEEGPGVVERVDLPGFEMVKSSAYSLKPLSFETSGRLCLGPWIKGAGPWADAYQVYMWVNVGDVVDSSPRQR